MKIVLKIKLLYKGDNWVCYKTIPLHWISKKKVVLCKSYIYSAEQKYKSYILKQKMLNRYV